MLAISNWRTAGLYPSRSALRSRWRISRERRRMSRLLFSLARTPLPSDDGSNIAGSTPFGSRVILSEATPFLTR